MDEYAGRVLVERYRLPAMPVGEEPSQLPAFDTYSGQEVLVHQVPLPEVVSAEVAFAPPGEEPPDVLGPEDDPGQRALRAALAAARIPDHPALVQVYDVFLDGGSLWVVTEWVMAQPLSAILAEERLSPYRAAEIGADVLGALRAVHTSAWTHRNVTADTVLLCDDGRAMLTGMAVAAAEEALVGNDPVPPPAVGPQEDGSLPPQDMPPRVRQGPAAERARLARMGVIGARSERWAPEQAGPLPGVNGYAPEVVADGPPSDMWALGVLLFRAIQGHPPFPEDSPVDLAEIVRTEPPAFAEECGPLRPIVESLLRKNPQERPDPEDVRGWLRSLIRTAPEPDLGRETVSVPADAHKIVEVRRRGEVAKRHRNSKALVAHGKHARGKRKRSGPRRLGLLLVGLVVLLVVAVLVIAALVLPGRNGAAEDGSSGQGGTGPAGSASSAPAAPPPDLSTDFGIHKDPSGFQLALHRDMEVKGATGNGQVWFDDGDDVEMIVVPGRDTAERYGNDVADYQVGSEPELRVYRKADWSAAAGLTRLTLNGNPAVEGEFSWRKGNRDYYGRNLAMLQDGKYHVVFVYGPDRDRSDISRYFEKAAETYKYGE
ncbi:protein kinase [Wenjunlia tyrosinilytica]|uniref:Protein kinase domain-containing protein n=1 Tax=Wenjunlia tyrosinilytica TaxID=1544741 RepID=A0A918DUY4_9ACTN|nr:protein kinase [Wenjunlia tyrosinilytica]GGO83503.1 hypothetical protein GCM10012280_12660 [Wenjunlia tyrosinilytica]